MFNVHDILQIREKLRVTRRIAQMLASTAIVCISISIGSTDANAQVAASSSDGAATAAATYANSDPLFQEPYVDIDEWRDTPVRHHYVHGGFKGTETRFSFYFPPKEKYQARFFQYITPVPDDENLAQKQPAFGSDNPIGFAIDSGV